MISPTMFGTPAVPQQQPPPPQQQQQQQPQQQHQQQQQQHSHQQQQQPSQTSILGQPPTPPLNPHMFGPPSNQQSFPTLPTRPNPNHQLYGHQMDSSGPPPPYTVPPPPFMNIQHFSSPAASPSISLHSGQGTVLKEHFQAVDPTLITIPVCQSSQGPGSNPSGSMHAADYSKFGPLIFSSKPDQQAETLPPANAPLLLCVSRSDGPTDTLFGNSTFSSVQSQSSHDSDTSDSSKVAMHYPPGSYQKAADYQPYPSILSNSELHIAGSSYSSATPSPAAAGSTAFIAVPPGVFATSTAAVQTTSAATVGDSLLPIGTERANKTTSTFPVITPGGFQYKSVANALMYYLVACRNYAIKCVELFREFL